MPGIVEFPKLVQDVVTQYGHLFANESHGGTSPNISPA